MGISDLIAGFIDELLREDNGTAELQRAELANRFNCVPSQINYVISTRFSPERGYIVESRRGGGGYIRIQRVSVVPGQLVMNTVNAIGDEIDYNMAAAFVYNALHSGAISREAADLMLAAVGNGALRPVEQAKRDSVRASILKQMLIKSI